MTGKQNKMAAMSTACSSNNSTLSKYYETLETNVQARYRDKVSLCDGVDPYLMKKSDFSNDLNDLPNLQFPDISNYLVVQTSFYTKNQMKAYKSMEAYNFFVSGWVHDIGIKRLRDKSCLIYARVNHSQRSTVTPLKTWVIAKDDGEILTAHCNCMAGLAESCSHVGAILFAVETSVRMRDSITCTMEKSKWLMPSHVKKITAVPVNQIDFSSPKAKKQRIDKAINGDNDEPEESVLNNGPPCPPVTPGSETYKGFFRKLNENFPTSAALMTKHCYHTRFIPKSMSNSLPKSIMDYRSPTSLELSLSNLLDECKKFKMSVNQSQVNRVEAETREQSGSRIWFRQRAGRITASRLKAVLHTSPENPSKSLIKCICYPEAHRFSNQATSYGCKHESVARKKYESMMSCEHDNFLVRDSGLRINPKWPYMGASPDGVVSCDCCGVGACEIKCPHCYQDKENLSQCVGEKGFCLVYGDDGDIQLDRKHSYYYQVQAQLNLMEVEYCDFIVWNKNDIIIERITPDFNFWNEATVKAEIFFRKCILPEVLGKHFTKSAISTLESLNRAD